MRKRKVERTISSGRRKSRASLFWGGTGWFGPSTTTLVIAEGCERTVSATSSLTIRGTEGARAGDLTTDGYGICAFMVGSVAMSGDPPGTSSWWIRRRIRWKDNWDGG